MPTPSRLILGHGISTTQPINLASIESVCRLQTRGLCQDVQAEHSRDADCSPDHQTTIRLHQTQPPRLRLIRWMLEDDHHQRRDMEVCCIYRRDCGHPRNIELILPHPTLEDALSYIRRRKRPYPILYEATKEALFAAKLA